MEHAIEIGNMQKNEELFQEKMGFSRSEEGLELSDEQRQKLWLKERDKLATLQDPQFAKAVEELRKEIAAKANVRAQKK